MKREITFSVAGIQHKGKNGLEMLPPIQQGSKSAKLLPPKDIVGACRLILDQKTPKDRIKAMQRCFVATLFDQNSPKLRKWRKAVSDAAAEAMTDQSADWLDPIAVACRVETVFRFARPKYHYTGKGALSSQAIDYPRVRPDLDKLLRAIYDSMSGIVFVDDALVCSATSEKIYVEGSPGVTINVVALEDERPEDGVDASLF